MTPTKSSMEVAREIVNAFEAKCFGVVGLESRIGKALDTMQQEIDRLKADKRGLVGALTYYADFFDGKNGSYRREDIDKNRAFFEVNLPQVAQEALKLYGGEAWRDKFEVEAKEIWKKTHSGASPKKDIELIASALRTLAHEKDAECNSALGVLATVNEAEIAKKDAQIATLTQKADGLVEALENISDYQPVNADGVLIPNMVPQRVAQEALTEYRRNV